MRGYLVRFNLVGKKGKIVSCIRRLSKVGHTHVIKVKARTNEEPEPQ
jgi:hypothetical protein